MLPRWLPRRIPRLASSSSKCASLTKISGALSEMSDVVYRQQQLIEQLERRVKALEKRLADIGEPSTPRDITDDVPPHY